MKGIKICSVRSFCIIVLFSPVLLGKSSQPPLCSSVGGILTNQFVFQIPLSALARVELRRCDDGSDTLQIAAWRSNANEPSLVIDTKDFGLVQAAARENVYVIETAGATRDQVFVILFAQGTPVLKIRRVTKGSARIMLEPGALNLVIPDIYNGDAPARTESYKFHLE